MAEVTVEKTDTTDSTDPSKRYNRFQHKKTTTQEPKFNGRCDDIRGFVFDCADGKQADRYNTTIREITAYVGRTYDYGGDVRWTIKNEEKYVPTKPVSIGTSTDPTDKRIWEKEIDEYARRKAKLTINCEKLYSLLLGQCTEHMAAKLASLPEFKKIDRALDVIKLINAIKRLSYQFEGTRYQEKALHQAFMRFYFSNRTRKCQTQNSSRHSKPSLQSSLSVAARSDIIRQES
jgi:hypothetical protein